MSLKTLYEKFLARPEQDLLAANATLNYITTTTTFTGAEAITKHLHSQSRVITKKSEKVLSAVEGRNSLCLDVELTIEFVSGGGSYLLSLDENFLIDRVCTFPLVHIVQFDSENKISQIRLYWDQGSLLKQVDVIGSHHRNWPIRDGSEQARLVNSSAKAAASAEPAPEPSQDTRSEGGDSTTAQSQSRSPERKTGHGPQASLSLFETLSMDDDQAQPRGPGRGSAKPPPRDLNELFVGDGGEQAQAAQGPGRGSAKPPPRDLNELFVGDEGDLTPTKPVTPPSKVVDDQPIRPRGGTGPGEENVARKPKPVSKTYDHFEFGEAEAPAAAPTPRATSKKHDHFEFGEAAATTSPQKPVKSKNYDHFEFGEDAPKPVAQAKKGHQHFEFGEVEPEPAPAKSKKPAKNDHFEFGEELPQAPPAGARSSKHMPQWDFEDFDSPQKQPQKPRPQEVRHFGWSDDENDQADSPQKQPRSHQPRRDAVSHFAFEEENTAEPDENEKPQRTTHGAAHNKGLGLYNNNLYDESGVPPPETESKSHHSIAVNAAHRHKDFDSHWVMTDEPALDVEAEQEENKNKQLSGDKMKAVKMMDSSWEMNDDEAANPIDTTAPPKPQRMSRNVNQRSWGFGDEDL